MNKDGNIKNYLTAHAEITATKHTSGVYHVLNTGTGTHAGPNATNEDYPTKMVFIF